VFSSVCHDAKMMHDAIIVERACVMMNDCDVMFMQGKISSSVHFGLVF
jgi:hypothetical protein